MSVDVQGVTGSSPVSSTIESSAFNRKRNFFIIFMRVM